MSMRNINLTVGEFFHVYNRGNNKQVIYKSPSDYDRFQLLLYLANSTESCHVQNVIKAYDDPYEFKKDEKLVNIYSYCLMPNHYHLVLSPNIEGGITQFMQKIGTAYSMFFNKKYERTGSLFEGRFKAKHADTDEYLKYLFSYIHMNPLSLKNEDTYIDTQQHIKNNFDYLVSYPYSSLSIYTGKQLPENSIVDTTMYEGYLPSHQNIYKELQDWLEFEYTS